MIELIAIWTAAICSWVVVALLLIEKKKRKQINIWANEALDAIRFRQELAKADQSGLITDWARAAQIDINDPMFADLTINEFTDVVQVRLADRIRRIKGEQ